MHRIGLLLVAAVACSDNTTSPSGPSGGGTCSGACDDNAGCAGGSVCTGGNCVKLCSSASGCNECSGMICSSAGFCAVDSTPNTGPRIDGITGNDAADTTRITDGFVVSGENLADADFTVLPASGAALAIAVRTQTDSEAEIVFPADVRSGAYTLTASNAAGSDQATVTLTLPELTGDALIDRINGASNTFDAGVLPVGTGSSDVAAGDHNHDARYYSRTDSDARYLTSTGADARYLPLAGGTISGTLRVDGNVGLGTAATARTKLAITSELSSAQPLTGTVSALTAGTTLTGNGTAFLNELRAGDEITVGGNTFTIDEVTDDDTATVSPAPSAGFVDQPYTTLTGKPLAIDSAAGAPLLHVDKWGNVGIGTDGPQHTLDVSGDARIGNWEYGQCRLEFDYIERPPGFNPALTTGSTIVQNWRETAPGNPYWPSSRLRAELHQWGWLCWNRTDTNVSQLHPYETANISHNQNYTSWVAPHYRICGRVTWLTGTQASGAPDVSSTNPRILVWAPSGNYYGLYAMEPSGANLQTSNHGLWYDGAQEVSGTNGATPDRWTVWTCR